MNLYWMAAALPLLVQFGLFARWLYRRMRDDEIQRAFVRDMALNHLPHLYYALGRIAQQLGVELDEPPPIRFLELDGGERRPRRW